MHAVPTCGVYVAEEVDLETVGDAGVDVGEEAAVQEGAGGRVDGVFVSALS